MKKAERDDEYQMILKDLMNKVLANDWDNISFECLELSLRITNSHRRAGVNNLGQLVRPFEILSLLYRSY